jgi:glucan phosphoethanolaminetransferase (alkaline phosphatase superfamily)
MPNEIRFSIDNSLKTLFGCIHMILTEDKVKKYVSYETFDIGKAFDEPTTIVYIIGESVNYRHMSLFGYERDTTPLLKDLAKSDNFYYVMGMAGGVNTLSSLKFMMNAIYEPDNKRQTSSDQTNLFKLAKSRGFKTFYISSQRDNVLASIGGVGYIDVIINNGSNISKVGKISDDQLLDQIKINELGDLNFIVLHQRCMHVPYSDWVEEARFDGNNEDDRIDKYDNAMLKNDRIISKIFGHFNGQKVGKFYIIWTSDHNELLGEDGLYGHGALVKKVAEVPFMIESNDGTFIDDIRGIGRMSHYGLAKAVAKVLGYEIKNPNEVNGMIYVSGADFNGLCGYMIFEGGGDDCKASLCRSSEGALPQSFEKDCGVVPTSLKNVQFKQ